MVLNNSVLGFLLELAAIMVIIVILAAVNVHWQEMCQLQEKYLDMIHYIYHPRLAFHYLC